MESIASTLIDTPTGAVLIRQPGSYRIAADDRTDLSRIAVNFGEAEVLYEPPNGAPHVIGMLHAGQFFGEMALLTGDARAATVVAKTDVECYRLDRASFQELLATKLEIGEEIKRVMGGRRGDLDTARQAFAVAPPTAEAEVRLSTKIRRFLLGS